MIFCGIWYGSEKPDTNVLFALLVKQFKEAYDGVKYKNIYE